jgi:hypothetical protein
MAVVNQVQKSGLMDLWEIVNFQLALHCHLGKISISDSDLDCLTLLAMNGEVELTSFCNAACHEEQRDRDPNFKWEKDIFKTPQSVRNSINKIENKGLIVKRGKSRKLISISSEIQVQTEGNIFVEVKFLRKNEAPEA